MTETTVSVHTHIGAPKSAAWELLADFGRPHKYVSGVLDAHLTSTKSTGVGTVRHCDLPPMMMMKQYIVEEVTHWDEGESFTYKITDASAPVKNCHVDWRVTGDETSCRISTKVVYTPSGVMGWMMSGMLRHVFNKQLRAGLDDIKRALEAKPQLRAA
jgi:hypothetical protein